jgi:hypothetical protein
MEAELRGLSFLTHVSVTHMILYVIDTYRVGTFKSGK